MASKKQRPSYAADVAALDEPGQIAAEVKPRKVKYLWKNRIPRGLISVVAGKPDQGKGLFATRVAADVSRQGGNVLYSAIEDPMEMMTRPRLEAAGANLENVFLWGFRLPDQMDELAEVVYDQQVRLIVMDPFSAHLFGVSKVADSIRKVLTPLKRLAEDTDASVLIVEHALKAKLPKGAHPLSALPGGSSGLPAAARAGYVFGTDPADDDRRVLCGVKSNTQKMPMPLAFEMDEEEFPIVGAVPSLVVAGECEFDASRLLQPESGDGTPGPKPTKRAKAAEWLTNYLHAAGKPVKVGQVIEDGKHHGDGLTNRTLRRAADEMGVLRNPPGGGRNCTWELPQDVLDVLDAGGDDDDLL